jgi:tetratricopeptide (TPR) repeat protein
MKNKQLPFILSILFCGVSLFSGQQNVSDEAQRYFDRGMAAVEMAKSSDENIPAIEEFNKAKALAPNWAEPYYQLAIVYEKLENYGVAITSLKHYLLLAPNASNVATVRSLINKLEYKQDQKEEVKKAFEFIGTAKFNKTISKDDKGPEKGWAWPPYFSLHEGVLKANNVFFDTSERSPYSDWPEIVKYNAKWIKDAPVQIKDRFFEYSYVYPVWGVSGNIGGILICEVMGKGEMVSTHPARIKVVVTLKYLSFFDKNERSVVILNKISDTAEYVIEYSDTE